MSFELEGQNFVVTGAARGIGLAISRRLTELGASVSGWDLNQDAMSGESLFHHRMRVDVSDEKVSMMPHKRPSATLESSMDWLPTQESTARPNRSGNIPWKSGTR